MSHVRPTPRPAWERAATYRILVQGALDPGWSDRLGGMRITTDRRAGHAPVTTLVGRLRDQAALLGVLNSLYDLHLPLMVVERVSGEASHG